MSNAYIARARDALERTRTVARDKKLSGDYRGAVRSLPAEIRQAGLGQALAMLRKRGSDKKGYLSLYHDIEKWMVDANAASPYYQRKPQQNTNAPRLLALLIAGSGQPGSSPQDDYRLAVAEIDAYLAVLKRHAEILIDAPEAA